MLTLVNRFLVSLEEEHERSANTAAAYRNDLTQFTRFITDPCAGGLPSSGDWGTVDGTLVDGYVRWLNEQPYAASTVARKVAAVRSFFYWLEEQGEIGPNPAQGIEAPRVQHGTPQPMEPEEIEQLLAEPCRESGPIGLRDRALLETLCATGMRVSEVVGLNLADLQQEDHHLHCGGKHSRSILLHDGALAALQQWVEEGRAQLAARPDDGALFLNHRGQRLTRQGLWLIIKRYVRQAGIEATVTPNTLRQSFAAHQLYAGADADEVAELLGVAGVQSTRSYRRAADALLGDGPLIIIDGAPLTAKRKAPTRG